MEHKDLNAKCPACGHPFSGDGAMICSQCNWEVLYLAENASEAVRQYNYDRLEQHKKVLGNYQQLKEQVAELHILISNLEKERSDLQNELNKANKDLEETRGKLRHAETNSSAINDRDAVIAQLSVKLRMAENQVKLLETNRLDKHIL